MEHVPLFLQFLGEAKLYSGDVIKPMPRWNQVATHKSSSRLTHRLPWRQTHANVMPCTADFHEQIADARLPQAAGVVDDAAAFDAAVDGLDAHATASNAPIRRLLRAHEGPAPWLPRRHDDADLLECKCQEAGILEQSAACRQGGWGDIGNPLIVGAAGIRLTQEEDRECRIDQQDVVDCVARFLAAITARLLNWILGALDAPLGPVVPKRGKAGAEAGAAAGGPDVRDGSFGGTASALASASVTRGGSPALSRTGLGHPPARTASRAGPPRARESADEPCSGPCRTVVPGRLGADRSSGRRG